MALKKDDPFVEQLQQVGEKEVLDAIEKIPVPESFDVTVVQVIKTIKLGGVGLPVVEAAFQAIGAHVDDTIGDGPVDAHYGFTLYGVEFGIDVTTGDA